MKTILEFLKAKNGSYMLVVLGVALPTITYPLSSLSQLAFLKQVAFAKNGVLYEPTITDYSLNVFGLFKLPFGVIIAISVSVFIVGVARLIYLYIFT